MKIKLKKPVIPKEIDADIALSVLIPSAESVLEKDVKCNYEFKGVSERTALGDELNISTKSRQGTTSQINFSLKRDSIYHILPEILFHSLDHYLGINGDNEEFEKRYKEQEEQRNNALAYFKPFDELFLKLRIKNEEWLNDNIFSGNQFLSDFITRGYNVNLKNPFIYAVYPCIPWLRNYRGNDSMIRVALQYAFKGKVDVEKVMYEETVSMTENIPAKIGGKMEHLFCGPTFISGISVWKVFYQTEISSKNNLEILIILINEFKKFFSEWFLPVESKIMLTFGDKQATPCLSNVNSVKGVFLNYSTQLQ